MKQLVLFLITICIVSACDTLPTDTDVNSVVAGMLCCEQTVLLGNNPSLLSVSESKSGDGEIYYQWQKRADNEIDWQNIDSAVSPNFSPVNLEYSTNYRVLLHNNHEGRDTTNEVRVIVNAEELIAGTLCCSQNVVFGNSPQPVSISGTSGGYGNFKFQWERFIYGNWQKITEAGSETSFTPNNETGTYRVRIFDAHNNEAVSNEVTITMLDYENIVAGTLCCNQSINVGTTPNPLTLTGTNGGYGVLRYEWQKKTGNNDWEIINCATTTYTPQGLTGNTKFRVKITDDNNGAEFSNEVTITVNIVAGTLCCDQTFACATMPNPLQVTGTSGGNGNYTYQWQRKLNNPEGTYDWENISNNNSSVLSFTSVNFYNAKYRVIVSDESNNSATTNEITISFGGGLISGGVRLNNGNWLTIVQFPFSGGTCRLSLQYSSDNLIITPSFNWEHRPNNHARIDAYGIVNCLSDLTYKYSGVIGNNILTVPAVQDGGYIITHQFDSGLPRQWIRLRIVEKTNNSITFEYENF
jgi:hypothetical protein